jgi:hypothetical protein
MNTATVTIARVEDHEGLGVCGHCDRDGLRWIVVLSDGSRFGSGCARKALGIKVAPKDFAWVTNYNVIAEHAEYGVVWTLYRHKRGERTVMARDGHLTTVGGALEEWKREGWAL